MNTTHIFPLHCRRRASGILQKFLPLIIIFIISFNLLNIIPAKAQGMGILSVDIVAGYNLVVDSNVESPSSFAPSVATVMGEFCNTGYAPLTGVQSFIGDYDLNTPGVYPVRDSSAAEFISEHSHLANTGLYSFAHIGGSVGTKDATRYIGTLNPGECKVQYWHITYPRRANPDNSGVAVWGASNDPFDDLWLEFDIWGTSQEGSIGHSTRKMTMRSEISAMANKIYPHDGIWFNLDSNTIYPGQVITSNGINYDLGNINKGFDNDGDFVYDYNAWLQPIGDPGYDPSCFRLIKTEGTLTISRSGGNPDMIIDFVDQLYFTNLPVDSNGARGEVHYSFLALDGPCSTSITPYQEVASGADNEKFNADFGVSLPPVGSYEPQVVIDKTGDLTISPGNPIDYSIAIANNGPEPAGNKTLGMPLVVSDAIPTGVEYQTGSATSTLSATILYSTDHGSTWSATEPVPASSVTNIQWWFDDPLAAGANGQVFMQVSVPVDYTGAVFIENDSCGSFGNGPCFSEDSTYTMVLGTNIIGDLVWRDLNGDGIQDGGSETGIANVSVQLFWDANADGQVDDPDMLITSTTTDANGYYSFNNLPNADFLVQVDQSDTDIPYGYSNTNETIAVVHGLNPISSPFLTADFGFGPALSVTKTLTTANPASEGQPIVFSIDLTNTRPGDGSGDAAQCSYIEYATVESPRTTSLSANARWTLPENAFGVAEEDDTFATTDFKNNDAKIAGTGFAKPAATGNIQKVEAIFPIYGNGTLLDDTLIGRLFFNDVEISSNNFTLAELNTFGPTIANKGFLTWDVTTAKTWSWDDFAGNLELELDTAKGPLKDNVTIFLDAIGFRITSDALCGGNEGEISVLPLADTYDANLMQFVSADPVESSVTTGGTIPYADTGVITWENLGPLNAGQTTTVTVTFQALEPPDNDLDSENDPASITNDGASKNATYASGGYVNDASDNELLTLNPTGTISGTIWNDNGLSGGIAANGIQDGSEEGIPSVTVQLFTDPNGDGDPADGILVDTQITQTNGTYSFTTVLDNTYVVVVDTTTFPGSSLAQTGDPNQPGIACTTCDDRVDVTINNNNGLSADDDIEQMNFGYQVPNTAYGNIWEDTSGEGVRGSLEGGIANVTVYLKDCGADGICGNGDDGATTTTTTGTNGDYQFSDITDGQYIVEVDPVSLPGTSSWNETADPDTTIDHKTTGTLSISGGNTYGAYDFGYTRIGDSSIGDTLYLDWNGDGQQSTGEEGIPNVRISLYEDRNGNNLLDPGIDLFRAAVDTNIEGVYTFAGLASGDYLVAVDTSDVDFPMGAIQTQDPDEPGVCATCDAQASAAVDGIALGSLDSIDFGFQPKGTASIGDFVWNDSDKDGIQDGGENGIPNIAVTLYEDVSANGIVDPDDAVVGTIQTDSNGAYLFDRLPAGDYIVQVDTGDSDLPVDGYSKPYVLSNGSALRQVILSADQVYVSADFGFGIGAILGDFIWQDTNRNGTQDFNEPGIGAISVSLYTDQNNNKVYDSGIDILYGTVETDNVISPGLYLFTGLPADDYIVTVDTTDSDLPSSVLTADPDESTPCTVCDAQSGASLSAGQINLGKDFGFQAPGLIGDQLWIDADGDGLVGTGEAGLRNITVSLYNASGSSQLATTTTDSDGFYNFSNVADGTYQVWVDSAGLPAGQVQTYDPDEGNACSTCDGKSTLTLSGGETILDRDFGYRYAGTYSINGTVFNDSDSDTVYEPGAGEQPYAGVNLYLWDSNHVQIGAGITDANGDYMFTNLPDGIYYVSINNSIPPLSGLNRTVPTPLTYYSLAISGANVIDQDFGYLGGSIGNFVWNDSNGDGIQDAGENGIANVTLALYLDNNDNGLDAEDTLVANASTGSNGQYVFIGLSAGKYIVNITDLYNVLPEFNLTGGTDPSVVSLAEGEVNESADFGYQSSGTASIGDLVWNDLDGDGIQDAGENGIANVTLQIYLDDGDGVIDGGDTDLGVQTTDANGAYDFVSLTAGDYIVDVTDSNSVLTNYTRTSGDDPQVVSISIGQDENSIDFGYQQTDASIGDFVWNDADGDGVQDAGESGIAGVTLEFYRDNNGDGLLDGGDTNLAAQATDATGAYAFTGLAAGNYLVDVTDTGSVLTRFTRTAGADPQAVTLTTGQAYDTADFGYQQTDASIGDLVWNDADGDGVQDAGESGIAGVTLDLYRDNNGDGLLDGGDTNLAAQATDATGAYAFTGLAAGDYLVDVTDTGSVLTGFTRTAGADPQAVTLTAGQNFDSADFGYQSSSTASIGDFVWNDADGDGVQDAGESGIAGVTLDLYRDNNGDGFLDGGDIYLATQTADANGAYAFSGLAAGDYLVNVTDTGSVLTGFTRTAGADPQAVTLTMGQVYDTADFGFVQLGRINGQVREDNDGDGNLFDADMGLSGVILVLSDGVCTVGADCPQTTTDSSGNYSFTELIPGIYHVLETNLSGYLSTADSQGVNDDAVEVSLNYADVSIGNDFLDVKPGLIRGQVRNDPDADGDLGDIDLGISGVTVELSNGLCLIGVDCPHSTTDSSGYYSFSGVLPGNYQIVQTDLSVYQSTQDSDGGNDNRISLVMTSGANLTNNDFLDSRLGSVGDYVWIDLDGDGDRSPGEPGLANVTVNLLGTGLDGMFGTGDDEVLSTLNSAADGAYQFTGLLAGNYRMDIDPASLPAGITQTGGTTPHDLVLGSGEVYQLANFGYQGNSAIGDLIWNDVDGNGLPETGEVGISNVTADLYRDNNANLSIDSSDTFIRTLTTNASGRYFISGLPTGAYLVSVTDNYNVLDEFEMTGGTDPHSLTLGLAETYELADFGFQHQDDSALDTVRELPTVGFTPGMLTPLSVPEQKYETYNMVLELPTLNIRVPIVGVPLNDGEWNVAWLGQAAGYLNGTAFPTWPGNTALAAHVYDANGQPGPFVGINSLSYGDRVLIHAWEKLYVYEVRIIEQVLPDDISSLGHKEADWVTLLTCQSYDAQQEAYRYRKIVQAVLVEVIPEEPFREDNH
jgi:LPXTG-site transpeptidase (sortase) family protein